MKKINVLENSNVLITGGTGMIGRYLVDKLLNKNYTPSIFSDTFDISLAISEFSISNNNVSQFILSKKDLRDKFKNDLFGFGIDNHPSRKGIDLWINNIYNKLV